MSDTKAVKSFAYWTILNSFASILIPLVSEHERIATANSSTAIMNKQGERGSPCLTLDLFQS